MKSNDSCLLLRGGKVVLEDKTIIKHPTIKDIANHGEEMYNLFITAFCSNPFDLIAFLYQQNIDYSTITEYDLFNILFPSFYYSEEDSFRLMVKEFFKIGGFLRMKKDGEKFVYVDTDSNTVIFNEKNFSEIKSVIKKLTGYTNKKEEKFANDFTKRAYIEDLIEESEFEQKEKKSGNTITFADLMGAVVLDTSYKYDEVWDLNLYQFHSCTRMILRREEYQNVMVGIYSGSIDAKNINKEELFWLNG